MDRFNQELLKCTRETSKKGKKGLKLGGVEVFIGLKQLKSETKFLDACLEYWDPIYHVFRFPGGEICPFVKEFDAIAGWLHRLQPVVSFADVGYKKKFETFFKLTSNVVDRLFVGDRVDMVVFVTYFSNFENKSILVESRCRALAFCLLHRDCFEGNISEGGDSSRDYSRSRRAVRVLGSALYG